MKKYNTRLSQLLLKDTNNAKFSTRLNLEMFSGQEMDFIPGRMISGEEWLPVNSAFSLGFVGRPLWYWQKTLPRIGLGVSYTFYKKRKRTNGWGAFTKLLLKVHWEKILQWNIPSMRILRGKWKINNIIAKTVVKLYQCHCIQYKD